MKLKMQEYNSKKYYLSYINWFGYLLKKKIIYILLSCIIIVSSTYLIHFYTESLHLYKKLKVFEETTTLIPVNEVESEQRLLEYKRLSVNLDVHKSTNPDTVGYLAIPYIDLSLPIVQGKDNKEYLKKDFYGKKSDIGWVFLDSRATNTSSDENMVIYGHNVTTNNMFGNLKNLLNYAKEEKQYIYYNTENTASIYEVVSVYITPYEEWSYTQRNFTIEEKMHFVDDLKKKSKYNNHTDYDYTDSFITLSTCYGIIGTENRIAIHGKKVYEEYIID